MIGITTTKKRCSKHRDGHSHIFQTVTDENAVRKIADAVNRSIQLEGFHLQDVDSIEWTIESTD
jgi:hypothetical protein